MSGNIRGKIVVITGASSELGEAAGTSSTRPPSPCRPTELHPDRTEPFPDKADISETKHEVAQARES